MKKRIVGIDVARALAVFGMIIVNFKVVLGEQGSEVLRVLLHFFDGKAAATFVVLAGVGIALMSKNALENHNTQKLHQIKKKILKRALFLFIIGLSYIWIWPADILHFYGVYMLVVILMLHQSNKQILIVSSLFIFSYPFLILWIDYELGWDFQNLIYKDFWTVQGFLRNLFFNGFHPVIPWAAFILFGLWYGRQNLFSNQFLKKSFSVGAIVFIGVQLVSKCLSAILSRQFPNDVEDIQSLIGTDPIPPMPLYMVNGVAISVVVISGCIYLSRKFESNKLVIALNKTGKLALTFYVAHVVLGMGLIEEFGTRKLGEYSIEFSLTYALLFSLLSLIFAQVWLKYHKHGPLEWLMRKLLD